MCERDGNGLGICDDNGVEGRASHEACPRGQNSHISRRRLGRPMVVATPIRTPQRGGSRVFQMRYRYGENLRLRLGLMTVWEKKDAEMRWRHVVLLFVPFHVLT